MRDLVARLRAVDYSGPIFELRMPEGLNDLNDLYRSDPAEFSEAPTAPARGGAGAPQNARQFSRAVVVYLDDSRQKSTGSQITSWLPQSSLFMRVCGLRALAFESGRERVKIAIFRVDPCDRRFLGAPDGAEELVRLLRIYRRSPAVSVYPSGPMLEDVLALRPARPGPRPRLWRHRLPPASP